METKNMSRAAEYYKFVGEKNSEEIKKFLHPDVEFYGPFATLKGKEPVYEATCNFMNSIESLTIRAKFGAGEQTMMVYSIDVPGIGKDLPGASFFTFRDGQIIRYEVFYDGIRFLEKKDEIFS